MPILSDDDRLQIRPYLARLKPTPIPPGEWDESPDRCVQISAAWASHVIGVLEQLAQPDTWIGTDEQRLAAVRQADEIITQLAKACEAGDTVGVKDVRVTDCGIEVEYTDNPGVWIAVGTVEDCIEGQIRGIINLDGGQFQVDYDQDGVPDLAFNISVTNNIIPQGEAYSWDHVYGGWYALAEWLEDKLESLLDFVDAGTNLADAITNLVEMHPGIEVAPYGSAVLALASIVAAGTAAVRSSLTLATREQFACDGFCIMKEADNKEFTLDVYHQFKQIGYNPLSEMGQWALSLTCDIFSDGTQQDRYQIGTHHPNPDWIYFCSCAEYEWIMPFDFVAANPTSYGFASDDHGGIYYAGVGFSSWAQYSDVFDEFAHYNLKLKAKRDTVASHLKLIQLHGKPSLIPNEGDTRQGPQFWQIRLQKPTHTFITGIDGWRAGGAAAHLEGKIWEWSGDYQFNASGSALSPTRVVFEGRYDIDDSTPHDQQGLYDIFTKIVLAGSGPNPFVYS